VLLPVLAGCVATMTVNTGRMRAALDASMLATELADYLVRKGLPFREAHQVVGSVVREMGEGQASWETAALQRLSPLFEDDVSAALDFRAAVERRSAEGGTSPESVRRQIAKLRQKLDQRIGITD
jgi:argininosuccinate lyase